MNQKTIRAEQKAEADYRAAEELANKRGKKGEEKFSFICGYLQQKLADAYGVK